MQVMESALGLALVAILIDYHGHDNDQAFDNVLNIGVYTNKGETAGHHAEDQRTDNRTGNPPDPSGRLVPPMTAAAMASSS